MGDLNLAFIESVVEAIESDGGVTFNPRTAELADPGAGYWVGGVVKGEVVEQDAFSAGDIVLFMLRRDVILPLFSNDNTYVGAWVDNGKVYLDVSEWVGSQVEAVRVGRERGEISVWDIADGEAILCADVDGTEDELS